MGRQQGGLVEGVEFPMEMRDNRSRKSDDNCITIPLVLLSGAEADLIVDTAFG